MVNSKRVRVESAEQAKVVKKKIKIVSSEK